GVPVLGVLPYIADLGIAEEDSAALGENAVTRPDAREIAVVALPHISNFDDMDPLSLEPGVRVRFVRRPSDLDDPAAVVLPGSKSTLGDLTWLHTSGFSREIRRLARKGRAVVGLCGGFQMLGEEVVDDLGVESRGGRVEGLGLLPVRTRMERGKTVTRSRGMVTAGQGFWQRLEGTEIEGYEIHMGRSETRSPLLTMTHREGAAVSVPDGACDESGRIFGTYLHGLFENDALRHAWLRSLDVDPLPQPFAARRTAAFDRLADALEASLDVALLDRIVEQGIR
ncbi:MAG TPA: cobyric acid synthase CobQ, partial [Spirochaetia bacterium]